MSEEQVSETLEETAAPTAEQPAAGGPELTVNDLNYGSI